MSAITLVEDLINVVVASMSKDEYKEFLLELNDIVEARIDAVNVELAEESEGE